MVYTHYWYRTATIEAEDFLRIGEDFRQLLPAFESKGLYLGNQTGREIPVITDDLIAFNGKQDCGHAKEFCVGTSKRRRCYGDCSQDTLFFPRILIPSKFQRPMHGGKFYNFLNTEAKPYDLAVQAFLIIAKQVLGDQIIITSDARSKDWDDARFLCYKHLGYGCSFSFDI